jgi:hypothetical protein
VFIRVRTFTHDCGVVVGLMEMGGAEVNSNIACWWALSALVIVG